MARDAKIPAGPGSQMSFATQARNATGIPTCAVGLITEPQQAEEIVLASARRAHLRR